MATASDSTNKKSSGDGSSGSLSGLGFSQTGREETTYEVMKPQSDPGAKMRTVAIVVVAIVGLSIVGFLAFQRSSLNPFDVLHQQENRPQFAPPPSGQ